MLYSLWKISLFLLVYKQTIKMIESMAGKEPAIDRRTGSEMFGGCGCVLTCDHDLAPDSQGQRGSEQAAAQGP